MWTKADIHDDTHVYLHICHHCNNSTYTPMTNPIILTNFAYISNSINLPCFAFRTEHDESEISKENVNRCKPKEVLMFWSKNQQLPGIEPRASGLNCKCYTTELQQLDNHWYSQSSISQIRQSLSICHQVYLLGIDWNILFIRRESVHQPESNAFLMLWNWPVTDFWQHIPGV